jgi:hypothetical protein
MRSAALISAGGAVARAAEEQPATQLIAEQSRDLRELLDRKA